MSSSNSAIACYFDLHLLVPMLLRRWAPGSSLEAAHMDSTLRLSVLPEAGDAFDDRPLLLLLIAVVRAARCFGARAALDKRRFSSRSWQPKAKPSQSRGAGSRSGAAVERQPCRAAEPQFSRNGRLIE